MLKYVFDIFHSEYIFHNSIVEFSYSSCKVHFNNGKYRRSYDLENTLRQHKITQDDLDQFHKMIESVESVPKKIPNKLLLPILVTCENNLGKSLRMLKTFFKNFKEHKEFFENRDVKSEDIQHALNNINYLLLPPTPNNYNLFLGNLACFDPKNFIFDSVLKTLFIIVGKT